jgi:hypothetical protein
VSTAQKAATEARDTTAIERERGIIKVKIECFARRLCHKYPHAFADGNGSDTKKQVIGWIRAALPPHAGRPRDATITLAWRLRRQGVPWPEIYPQCIENLAALSWRERRQRIRRLRNAYRGRRRLTCKPRSKNPSSISNPEKN